MKEIEDGLRAEFDVPSDMIGLVIGKGGANVNSVKEQTGVERIVVDTDAGVVRIVGHAREDVERAREMLEYAIVFVGPMRIEPFMVHLATHHMSAAFVVVRPLLACM